MSLKQKGVNLPGVRVSLPGITEKDAEDIRFGIKENVDFIAASFVRRPSDVLEIREILEEQKLTFQYSLKLKIKKVLIILRKFLKCLMV